MAKLPIVSNLNSISTILRSSFVPKKAGKVIVTTTTAAILLAACGTSSATSATSSNTKVTNVSLWESHNGGPVAAEMTALVDKFNSTHKNIQVHITVTKASKKLLAAVAAGNSPILAEISHYDGQYIKDHALLSWNGFVKNSSNISSSSMFPVVWKNGQVGTNHYRLQADAKLSVVFYNQTMFSKAGIASPPKTWNQLSSDAAKLKAPGVIPVGWKDSSAHILPAFLSNGGTMLKGSNSVGKAVDFNSPAGVKTFTYFRNLYASQNLVFDHGSTLRQDFASGHMAMIDGTSAGYQKVLNAVGGKFKVGAFVEPAGSTGHAANISQGLGFVLPKGHSQTQDKAAATFVRWWFAPTQQAAWAETTGYAPETHKGAAAIPASFISSHPGLKVSIQAISSPYTLPRPVSDSYKEVQAALDSSFLQIAQGKVPVVSGLKTLDQQGDSYMNGSTAL